MGTKMRIGHRTDLWQVCDREQIHSSEFPLQTRIISNHTIIFKSKLTEHLKNFPVQCPVYIKGKMSFSFPTSRDK